MSQKLKLHATYPDCLRVIFIPPNSFRQKGLCINFIAFCLMYSYFCVSFTTEAVSVNGLTSILCSLGITDQRHRTKLRNWIFRDLSSISLSLPLLPWFHGPFTLALASLRITIHVSGIFLWVSKHVAFLRGSVVNPAPKLHHAESSDFLSGFTPCQMIPFIRC
jgi:hypothetical protein